MSVVTTSLIEAVAVAIENARCLRKCKRGLGVTTIGLNNSALLGTLPHEYRLGLMDEASEAARVAVDFCNRSTM